MSTLGGAAYFGEFGAFKTIQMTFFPIGIVLTLSGVYILSSRDMKKNNARTGGVTASSEMSEVVSVEVGQNADRPSSTREADAIQLESNVNTARHGLPAGDSQMEPTSSADYVQPLAAGMLQSDDPEEIDVVASNRASGSQKYAVPSPHGVAGVTHVVPMSPTHRPPVPDREYPVGVAASMPHSSMGSEAMFTHTHGYNGGSGQYPPPASGSSRPSTAGDKRMSRFAQRQSRAASRVGEPGGMFTSALAAHAAGDRNFANYAPGSSGQWPARSSIGEQAAQPARHRTRSTWAVSDHSRGSVFHAGLALLGATGPPDEI